MLLEPANPNPLPANPSVNFTSTQIVIQIGERYFGVNREALQRHRSSLFGSVLQQVEQAQRGGQGGVVSISRSPVHFPIILNYLNNGLEGLARLRLNEADLQMVEELLVEAEFYRLPELSAFVKVLLKPELNREVVQHLLKRPTAPRDFANARLVGLDLSDLDFVNIEIKGKESRYLPTTIHRCEFKPQFSKANLQWVNFSRCNLQGTNFQGAKLAFTNLTEANLTSASFDGAHLSKALLVGANLTSVSFQKVHLSEVDFTAAKLTEVSFEEVDVSSQAVPFPPHASSSSSSSSSLPAAQAGHRPSSPSPASFRGGSSLPSSTPLADSQGSPGCSFERAHFERANLSRARFSGCQMKGARFEGCNLTEADLSSANLEGCEFLDCTFTQATLAHANLKGARLIRCNLSYSLLNHANLTFTQLFSSDFTQAQLVASNLQCAELFEFSLDEAEKQLVYRNHPTFRGACFRFALLQGVDFHQVDCTGADFRDANLTNAIMKDTKMEHANLEGAILKRRIVEDFDAEWVVTKKGKTMEDVRSR